MDASNTIELKCCGGRLSLRLCLFPALGWAELQRIRRLWQCGTPETQDELRELTLKYMEMEAHTYGYGVLTWDEADKPLSDYMFGKDLTK